MNKDPMNKIAVVTGAGSGVGQAVALRLARENWNVALLGRRIEALHETISGAGTVTTKLVPIACDVSVESEVMQMADHVRKTLGAPTALVNSAGVNVPKRSLGDLSTEDYRHIIEVNLNGAFYTIHAFLPDMRAAGIGTIVNVISDAGLSANRISGAAYIASKFGLSGLTATINAEERKNGIRACALFPGELNTPLLDIRPTPPPPEARTKMLQPEDVADCIMLALNLPDRAVIEQLVLRPR